MNFRLFLAVEWGRAVGVKLECVRFGGGGGGGGVQSEMEGFGWLGGCCGITLYFDTGGQRSSTPSSDEKLVNWGWFIQQKISPFRDFQKRFWPLQHLCSCA